MSKKPKGIKSREVQLGRISLHRPLADGLMAIPSMRRRGRTVAAILDAANGTGVDPIRLAAAREDLLRLGLLLNQSLRLSLGHSVDQLALQEAVELIRGMKP